MNEWEKKQKFEYSKSLHIESRWKGEKNERMNNYRSRKLKVNANELWTQPTSTLLSPYAMLFKSNATPTVSVVLFLLR